MALIKCPECGKEISDRAGSCPSCGCPLETANEPKIEIQTPKKNVNVKKFLPIIIGVVIVAIIGIVVYNIKVVQPKKLEAQNKATYEEAISLLEKGKYEEANQLFETISNYEDVTLLQEQLYYESRVFQCIKLLKERLKNPDSLQIYEVVFFGNECKDNLSAEEKEELSELISAMKRDNEPFVLMRYGAQNGFGGNTTGYALFIYENNTYKFFGACKTLDEDEVDEDEKDACIACNIFLEDFKMIGNVDIDRIKQVLKDDNYSTIKIIE